MLSICIPVYNWDTNILIQSLLKQSRNANTPFEILLFDDCSTIDDIKLKHRPLNHEPEINYQELPSNIGRSKIRNKLANEAKFNHLLFLDCDSACLDDNFINNYLKHLEDNSVIYGGTIYKKNKPNPTELLRWTYGHERESTTAINRNKTPHLAFKTNNFAIRKDIFKTITFNENLTQYGHEDTLFAIELENKNIDILHIDNPVYHLGLDTSFEFIKKTNIALDNLLVLQKAFPEHQLNKKIKVLKWFNSLQETHLLFALQALSFALKKIIEKNLTSSSPNLKLFDLHKLLYLSTKKTEQ